MTTLHSAYIGLGSNLDNPVNQVLRATRALKELSLPSGFQLSPLYQTKPVGPPQPDYINAVVRLETELPPLVLLDALQAIEAQHQRERKIHWGPRTLDLDILLYDDLLIDNARLKVPHPYLCERTFVIAPLYYIAPELVLPNGTPLKSLWAQCSAEDLIHIQTVP